MLLGWCTRVGGFACGVESTLVADADRVSVVAECMSTDHLLGPSHVQLSVAGDVIMISATLPPTGFVAGLQVLEGELTVTSGGRAVDNDQINPAHDCTKKVDTVSVMMVATYLSNLPIIRRFELRNLSMVKRIFS